MFETLTDVMSIVLQILDIANAMLGNVLIIQDIIASTVSIIVAINGTKSIKKVD